MRHFDYLNAKNEDSIFFQKPARFSKDSEKELLAQGMGATLYMPGTRPNISGEITAKKYDGLVSMALCLEDAIGDHEVEDAEMNIITHLQQLYMNIEKGLFKYEDLPLIFIRVRNEEQMRNVAGHLGSSIKVLSGFIFPKFNPENGHGYIQALLDINEAYGMQLYGMPILESEDIIYKETRVSSLMKIKELLDQNYGRILNVRMGATDFCGLYGIRRGSDTTIYDISVVRDCIADIVNVFARSEKEYVISGPVWEYFHTLERVMKPQLRQTPFRNSRGTEGLLIRENILNNYLDGLIKEVLLDKTNGLTGKTIIHPTHILPVHSFSVVSFEEYLDAMSIMESAAGDAGVKKSQFSNKMNEMKPHFNWANKIMTKARAYGVYHEQSSYIDLLAKQESIHI
ncbi:HpcH/HpaI aldolase/citrate lyase family protein [Bacillus sp. MUM 13]|uniref:HpcH/HpaI aldolase/citrate lyase family protein n=1 Tax=Bacillus sp. MUM 13 TaxID=1678001 RepID=UPI0008F5D790|nr:HpcH/HpaI aldolase/citrate lyase family protein [Bacillus sp. MUM 13]OIK08398.1 citrate lyase subunit beta [Bacillus sp. MUM 13]